MSQLNCKLLYRDKRWHMIDLFNKVISRAYRNKEFLKNIWNINIPSLQLHCDLQNLSPSHDISWMLKNQQIFAWESWMLPLAFSLETVAKIFRGERRASPLSLPSSLVLTLLITGSPAGLVSLPSNRQHINQNYGS